MAAARKIPPPTAIAGGNCGAMPNANKTNACHSVAHRHAAAAISQGAGGFNGAAGCASERRNGQSAQKISAAMTAAAIATAVSGGLYAGTWKAFGRAI